MITSIRGTLQEAGPLSAVIECGGIGYEVLIPVTTAEKLPTKGHEVFLHTTVVYREDSQTLYGFTRRDERDFFLLLVEKVSGIGPRIALSILSKLSIPVLQQAISSGDTRLLAQCPGIGKKTAERMIIELRDKALGGSVFAAAPSAGGSHGAPSADNSATARHNDAVTALVTLGYKATDADRAVRAAMEKSQPEATVEELIRRALAGK